MSILKIAHMGHPVLRKVARDLTPEEIRSPEIQRLIEDMVETMVEHSGSGWPRRKSICRSRWRSSNSRRKRSLSRDG